ncbi:2-oxopent-4-enoate/cis-2-oxohex-4-enoate hydratase [Variovorax boronicumulans]|uniref:2-keto-4-pentenoate hydratase n=1 Tax=Variovorax boronicumulans TaxID=436515 RepID=UPI002782134C|nr:fumarylacetoacetate hydrolase family protein [Variovorax boronicumulans]MDP9995183.1 2-oxopent-4-enoate/cis-2-oxohex-4-enoate hydratase [Variovorax boronicumulans]MDQ0006473.1 2-oxopent-4-enoate/cis-2-oxohex-4-enoate hydratase [Variovorax boronicumulans]
MAKITKSHPSMNVHHAYAVQREIIRMRTAAGAKVIGRKIGLTSKAAQQMLKVGEPDFGVLMSDMLVPTTSSVPRASLIAPKAEGEIAFVLKKDLHGPRVNAAEVLAATEGVMACFEIVDSRIENWDIALQDTVADNASSGLIVMGDRMVDPREIDLAMAGMVLEKNGEVVLTGAGAAALGSPVNAVAWLASALFEFGEGLSAGEIILSGSLAAMVPVNAGDQLRMSIGGIGACSVRFH